MVDIGKSSGCLAFEKGGDFAATHVEATAIPAGKKKTEAAAKLS
jgi:hypothetical protein